MISVKDFFAQARRKATAYLLKDLGVPKLVQLRMVSEREATYNRRAKKDVPIGLLSEACFESEAEYGDSCSKLITSAPTGRRIGSTQNMNHKVRKSIVIEVEFFFLLHTSSVIKELIAARKSRQRRRCAVIVRSAIGRVSSRAYHLHFLHDAFISQAKRAIKLHGSALQRVPRVHNHITRADTDC